MLLTKVYFCLALLCLPTVTSAYTLTQVNVQQMVDRLRYEMVINPSLIAGAVRLLFHSCQGPPCNGCVNLNNPSNAGLKGYIDQLVLLRQDIHTEGLGRITNADFLVLAGITAIHVAAKNTGILYNGEPLPCPIPFTYGREDREGDCPYGHFPGPYDDSISYLIGQFNLTRVEAVALMGAHTLGRAHPYYSGFMYPWTPTETGLDNSYYKTLMRNSWRQGEIRTAGGKVGHQWSREVNSARYLMLSTDMKLYLRLSIPEGKTRSTCSHPLATRSRLPPCPRSKYACIVSQFAKSDELFKRKFVSAVTKMITCGSKTLKEPL